MRKSAIGFLLMMVGYMCYAQTEAVTNSGSKVLLWEDGTWTFAASTINGLEIPAICQGDTIISHTGYSFVYNEQHEQASWIAYHLSRDKTNRIFDRTDRFVPDPYVTTGTAANIDYAGSGYDRGHLSPASDMGWSELAMAQSFYYSNISPQTPGFNRGVWKRLEELVRSWAIGYGSIYIVTGPVLSDSLPYIGENNVSVAQYFYKVVLHYDEHNPKGIGFILPHESSGEPLYNFAVSIDSVQTFTGIDFFPALPDELEQTIENSLCVECWNWTNNEFASDEPSVQTTSSVQCRGVTRAGNRCNNRTKNEGGFCHLHKQVVD